LIGSLIAGEIVSVFGADLYAAELNADNGNYLNQTALENFLSSNMYDGAVEDWSFVSQSMGDFLSVITNNNNYDNYIGDLTGYNLVGADVFSVP
jgi:hypothetical protein